MAETELGELDFGHFLRFKTGIASFLAETDFGKLASFPQTNLGRRLKVQGNGPDLCGAERERRRSNVLLPHHESTTAPPVSCIKRRLVTHIQSLQLLSQPLVQNVMT